MGMSDAVMSEGEFREKLADVERLMKDVNSNVDKLFAACNRSMRFMPPGVSHGMAAALGKLNELISEFFTEMAKILLNPGWPFALLAAGDEWTSKVGGPLSQMSAKLGADQMRLDRHWSGPAAEAYANVVPAQQKALESIKPLTDSIDSNLTKAAVGIFAMWAGVIIAVIGFVSELGAEAGAATTGVGAPPAAAAAGVSTVKVIGLVTACLGLFVAFVGTIVDSVTSLNQSLHNGGAWPQATISEFNDGSLSDGDTTDWRYKTDD